MLFSPLSQSLSFWRWLIFPNYLRTQQHSYETERESHTELLQQEEKLLGPSSRLHPCFFRSNIPNYSYYPTAHQFDTVHTFDDFTLEDNGGIWSCQLSTLIQRNNHVSYYINVRLINKIYDSISIPYSIWHKVRYRNP